MPAYGSSEDDHSDEEDELSDDELAAALPLQQQQAARGTSATRLAPAGSEEEDTEGTRRQGGATGPLQREAIYNVDAIHDKLEDIGWVEEQAWEEAMALTSSEPVTLANAEDDLERELAFYNQALEAAQTAVRRFEAAGIAWQRPNDYYAEMVKSDEHMAKVKEQLLYEKQQIEATDQRKKDREAKKFSKQVAAERKKERAQDKKATISGISKLRKQREKTGYAGDLDVDAELDRLESGGGGGRGGRQQQQRRQPGERFTPRDKSKKREQRDSKFGFGGPKRKGKQNDAASVAAVDGYRPSRFDDGVGQKADGRFAGRRGGIGRGSGGGRGKGRGGGFGGSSGGGVRTGSVQKKMGGKQQRPGKDRRAAMKQGRRAKA